MQNEFIFRKATVKDVPGISEIVKKYAQEGIMLPRPISKVYDNLRDYYIIENDGNVIGCGALHVTWSDLAEIRALAILKEFNGRGLGRRIVEHLMEEAKSLMVEKVFVLTYQKKFFEKMDFSEISKSELPQKIWSECVNCVHFPDCDEIAMLQVL